MRLPDISTSCSTRLSGTRSTRGVSRVSATSPRRIARSITSRATFSRNRSSAKLKFSAVMSVLISKMSRSRWGGARSANFRNSRHISSRKLPRSGTDMGLCFEWRMIAAEASAARVGHRRYSTGRLVLTRLTTASNVNFSYPPDASSAHAASRIAVSRAVPRRRLTLFFLAITIVCLLAAPSMTAFAAVAPHASFSAGSWLRHRLVRTPRLPESCRETPSRLAFDSSQYLGRLS